MATFSYRPSRENLVIFILASVILALFTALWLVPTLQQFQRLRGALPAVEQRIRDLAQAQALADSLAAKTAALPSHTFPGVTPVPVAEAESLLTAIRRAAVDAGLTETDLTATVTGGGQDQRLQVQAAYQGSAEACRRFLRHLLAQPAVTGIQQAVLEAGSNAINLTLSFAIAVG